MTIDEILEILDNPPRPADHLRDLKVGDVVILGFRARVDKYYYFREKLITRITKTFVSIGESRFSIDANHPKGDGSLQIFLDIEGVRRYSKALEEFRQAWNIVNSERISKLSKRQILLIAEILKGNS